MNKIVFTCLLLCLFVLNIAHADLYNRGSDSVGNRLIYDSDLNITWYDYTNDFDTWQNQYNWVSALTVTFSGIVYYEWRLPSTVDDPYVWGYDGTTTAGYNITNSEMGHLYYEELGGIGHIDTSGNEIPDHGLPNTGPFLDLRHGGSDPYWSGTNYSEWGGAHAWYFSNRSGEQLIAGKTNQYLAIAVMPGDVTVVPEPISLVLFIAGGAILAGNRSIRRKMKLL